MCAPHFISVSNMSWVAIFTNYYDSYFLVSLPTEYFFEERLLLRSFCLFLWICVTDCMNPSLGQLHFLIKYFIPCLEAQTLNTLKFIGLISKASMPTSSVKDTLLHIPNRKYKQPQGIFRQHSVLLNANTSTRHKHGCTFLSCSQLYQHFRKTQGKLP